MWMASSKMASVVQANGFTAMPESSQAKTDVHRLQASSATAGTLTGYDAKLTAYFTDRSGEAMHASLRRTRWSIIGTKHLIPAELMFLWLPYHQNCYTNTSDVILLNVPIRNVTRQRAKLCNDSRRISYMLCTATIPEQLCFSAGKSLN